MHIPVSRRQLLKHIQVPEVCIQRSRELITQSCKQPILIKIVIYNVLARIDMQFIVKENKRRFGGNLFVLQRYAHGKIITETPIKPEGVS